MLPGAPPPARPGEARRIAVEGFRQAARVAAEHGLTLGTRAAPPRHLRHVDDGLLDPGDDRPDGRDRRAERAAAVRRLPPARHRRRDRRHRTHGSRIAPSVHICDWRDPTRNDFDRVLPGDGIIDLPGIFGALDVAAHPQWVDLEIFSDDGSFSEHGLRGLALEAEARRRRSRAPRRASTRRGRRGGRPPDAPRGQGRARHRCRAAARHRPRHGAGARRRGGGGRRERHRRDGGRGPGVRRGVAARTACVPLLRRRRVRAAPRSTG